MSNNYEFIKVPFNNIKKIDIINVQGGISYAEIMEKYQPDILINLALYDSASKINITHMEDENVSSGYLFSNYGIGIKGNRELVWTDVNNAKLDDNIRDYVSGSPTLVANGKEDYDWGNKYSAYVNGTHKRSAIGFNNNELILCSTNIAVTIDQLRKYCLNKLDARYMINCDGGGSCHLQLGSEILVKSVRENVSWLLVYLLKDNEMIVKVDGKDYIFESKIIEGRTYVKLRDFEQAGYIIGYNNGIPSIDKP